MRTITLVAFIALSLTGCATTPTPVLQAKSTPNNRVYFPAGNGVVTSTAIFVRDTGFASGGLYMHLSINGKKAAAIDVGEKVTFRLPSGEYVFRVTPTDPMGGSAGFGIDQNLIEGRTYTYRILTDGNLQTRIERVIDSATQ
ncbi:MAG: hypothetical protein Q7J75_02575 [Rhodoferax sp.]|nr:hypothetical protein [Rhodoferax sp.]